jgi:hypothetical protein
MRIIYRGGVAFYERETVVVENPADSDYLAFPSTYDLFTNNDDVFWHLLEYRLRVRGTLLAALPALERPRFRIQVLTAGGVVRSMYSAIFAFGQSNTGLPIDSEVWGNRAVNFNGSGFDPLNAGKISYYTGVAFPSTMLVLPGESMRLTMINENTGGCIDSYKWSHIYFTFSHGKVMPS